jgi:hypothetical protein
VFCVSVSVFFLKFSISWVTFSLTLSIFNLNSFISVFMVFSVSLWYLFRAPMSSFIYYCVFPFSLFLLFWNFLSASCTFWLTMSSNISMKFSVITCRIPSFRVFLWALLVPWYSVSLFCWYLFSHIPLNPVLIYFLEGRMVSIPLLFSHCSTWCYFCPWSVCDLVLANLQQ